MTEYNYDSLKVNIDNHVIHATYPLGLRWECKRCAKCCRETESRKRTLLLLEKDVERLLKHSQDFYVRVLSQEPFIGKMKIKNCECVFLDKQVCTVYGDRALLCRTYPFFIEIAHGIYGIKYDRECPGIGAGRIVSRKFFEELLKKCVRNRGIGYS